MAKIGEYKKHQNELPYSIKDTMKGSAKAYNDMIEANSFDKLVAARQRAIDAWQQVQSNRQNYFDGKWMPPTSAKRSADIPKPSIISRIYNWFLNINY